MGYIGPAVVEKFKNMFEDAKVAIANSGIEYSKVGVFGSFARNEYKSTSDIDFVLIMDKEPDKIKVSILRGKLEEIGCDLVLLHHDNFENPKNLLQKEIKRDFVEVLI